MADIDPQHIQPLSFAFVGALVFAILVLGAVNFVADK